MSTRLSAWMASSEGSNGRIASNHNGNAPNYFRCNSNCRISSLRTRALEVRDGVKQSRLLRAISLPNALARNDATIYDVSYNLNCTHYFGQFRINAYLWTNN